MKLSGIRYLIKQGVDNVWKNRVMAFASFCVLLVSLLLVGISCLFFLNLNSIIGGIENKNEVIIYLQDDTSDQQIEEMGRELEQMDNISSVSFYSKEEAFADLQADMLEYEVLFESLGDDNPLPDAYRIRVADISRLSETLSMLNSMQNVDRIRAPYDFVNVLTGLRRIVSVVALAVVVALVIVSMVIISNTTRASVFARRREISIMKYVGATNAFIRLPFFVEGMLTGLMAGAMATVITWFTYDSLVDLLKQDADILSIIGVGSIISYNDVALPVTLAYLGAGALVGAIGSVISTRKHLKV
ncbi:permease-like cell division protein FtsX [Ruminococcus sp.]|uniref:permease-like cell division protein FtsX n=1 Tax=Ruminococcus sp. TaxID=41978 RepID=UPI0025D632EC|nr:permease-like cell division protein FtsX [Ruminococcus sp.]MCI5815788.1 permease-like cell division protein FtsX [Ruminococcus sp.]